MQVRFFIRPPRQLAVLTLAAAFFATFFVTSVAHARLAGVSSTLFLGRTPPSCNACHTGGTAPTVNLTASSNLLVPGTPITLTFTVTTINSDPGAAGFNLRSSQQGTFAVGGPSSESTRVEPAGTSGWSEMTHSAPKVGEPATFTALWTPGAAVTGTVTFTAWGNSVNQSGTTAGDQAASTTLDIAVCTATTWYRDMDGDTYGNPSVSTPSCSQPAGYVANAGDCNDGSAAIRPGATEVCNGVDDNCSGSADEGLATSTFYRDMDGDTYGSLAVSVTACSQPAGYVANASDCHDGNGGIHPGVAEICNGLDDDCNNVPDDGIGTLSCGDGPCHVTVPACLAGVTQVCVPMCPDAGPDADASAVVPPPVDASPAPDVVSTIDAALPPPDARPADSAMTVDAVSTSDARADIGSSDGAPTAADGAQVADAVSTSDAGTMADAVVGSSSDARADARPDGAVVADGAAHDGQVPSSDAGADDMPGEGCSCRVGSSLPSPQGAMAMAGAMLLLMAVARRRRRGSR